MIRYLLIGLLVIFFTACQSGDQTSQSKTETPVTALVSSSDEKSSPTGRESTTTKPQNSTLAPQLSSIQSYLLGELTIQVTQEKGKHPAPACTASLVIRKEKDTLLSKAYTPEPVGGNYGISCGFELANHLIFSKYGHYDGTTMVVNQQGELFEMPGGQTYYDEGQETLINFYDSDIWGLSVFDLESDSMRLKMIDLEDQPISVHKAHGGRYFLLCFRGGDIDAPKVVWEIEDEMGRFVRVDIEAESLHSQNILSAIPLAGVSCACEEE